MREARYVEVTLVVVALVAKRLRKVPVPVTFKFVLTKLPVEVPPPNSMVVVAVLPWFKTCWRVGVEEEPPGRQLVPLAKQTLWPETSKEVRLALVPVMLVEKKLVEVTLVPVAAVQVRFVVEKLVDVALVTVPLVAVSVARLSVVPVALVKMNCVEVAADKTAVPPSKVTVLAVKFNAVRLVEEAVVAKKLVVVALVEVVFPWRLTVKTAVSVSLMARIRKSLALEVPWERTSRVERVPVAAVLEAWLSVKTVEAPKAEVEAYMPCKRSALNA